MAYESSPVPLPTGSLEPPRRFPPTAVGTMAQPPRRPRRSHYPAGPSLVRRVALRGLALICLLGSAAVLWPLSWQSSVGAGLMSLSVHVAHRSLVPQRGSRVVALSDASPDATGESRERSA
jgi:hypothetical protein